MRSVKLGFLVLMAMALAFAFGGSALAFHSEAGLICSLCHTMHNSQNGSPMVTAADGDMDGAAQPHLLLYENKSELCLSCHSLNDAVNGENPPDVYTNAQATPGGDFALAATGNTTKGHNPWHIDGAGGTIDDDEVMTDGAGGVAGSGKNIAPGSAVALWEWSCLSCHRPHKDTGLADSDIRATYSHRLLRKHVKGPNIDASGADYEDVSTALDDANMIQADLIAANVNTDAETALNHNVYEVTTLGTQGFGQWCGACHSNPDDAGTGFHGAVVGDDDVGNGTDWIRHPTATILNADLAGNYGLTYNPAIPLEVTDAAELDAKDDVAMADPYASYAQVSCLSCHKAHASAFADATRWDMAGPSGVDDNCNKCHGIGD